MNLVDKLFVRKVYLSN